MDPQHLSVLIPKRLEGDVPGLGQGPILVQSVLGGNRGSGGRGPCRILRVSLSAERMQF